MRLIRLVSVVGCGLVFLAAGCGSQTTGGSTSTTTASAPTSTSPSVPNPLSLAKLNSDPCAALSATQLAPYIGPVDSSTADTSDPDSAICDYHPTDLSQATISVSAVPNFGGVANLGKPGAAWSQKIGDIASYPAEHESLGGSTGPQTGDCGTTVVISDQAAVNIYVQASDSSYKYYSNLCVVSDALAPDVIAFLKSGG